MIGLARALGFAALATAIAPAQRYTLDSHVFAGGGSTALVGGGLELGSTVGEGIVGGASAGTLWSSAGFWSSTAAPPRGGAIRDLHAVPGPARLLLTWESPARDLVGFVIDRRTGTGGALARIGNIRASSTGSYEFLDLSPVPGTVHTYLISEVHLGGLVVPRATIDAAAYGTTLPPNVTRAGRSGSATIQAAIAAAPTGAFEWVVTVEPGTYPAFTVDASAPHRLRVIADGTGPVTVDTSAGPVRVQSRVLGQSVELAGLSIGSATTPQDGVSIDGCAGVVILDRVDVTTAPGSTAVDVRNSSAVAIQRASSSGGTGLHLDGARVVASRSDTTGIDLDNGSRLTAAELSNSGALTADPSSSLLTLPGVMPNVDAPVFAVPGVPTALSIDAAPNVAFTAFVSTGNGWLEFPPIDTPLLLDLSILFDVAAGATDAAGRAGFAVVISPATTSLLGQSLTFQVLTVDPATATLRLSNVTTKVFMP